MRCPNCGYYKTHVTDTRNRRRRRVCDKCKKRFSTIEVLEEEIIILKRLINKINNITMMKIKFKRGSGLD